MDKKEYKKIVDRHKPTETRVQNAVISFLIGGLVGLIGQGLIDFYSFWLDISTKDASTFMIVTLVFIASLFTALGFFDKWVTFAKCGLIIPITGFAHSMTSAGIEYRKEGPIYGLGMNIFKLAGSVILYGIVAAWVFGTLRYLLLGGI